MIQKNLILHRPENKPIVWDAFFNTNGEQKPLVVFCHGYKGFKDWGSWDLVAEAFKNANLFFVKFNFSHNGGTVENPIDFPDLEAFAENNYTKELSDLDAILNHLLSINNPYKSEIDTHNITLIGHSRGGGISIIKASEDSRITKLITWASVSDFGKRTATIGDLNQWKKDGVKYILNGRTKQQMPHNYQFYEDFLANKDRLNIEASTKSIKIPHLIIHGKDDPSVLFNEAENLNAWNSKNTLFAIENANHVFNSKHPWSENEMPDALNLVVKKSIDYIK
ncbi:alpha/beta hydrolase family protein [Ichthyenterobacterium magnum]|uniref:Pimeloyl-ACP methyl ester carboxylesterase n=1 Tax=Ichthyenterobacterium magnum TaxID=1230530 RepID=A0A420DWZ6_9FLAO|nr:alpha/beta hydrolase [Ichthyenterobacterium magnum]RKE98733.1 pimeloyl-ACP methyl ester carboxylesterase [Ichthyenterobacterium magnum]